MSGTSAGYRQFEGANGGLASDLQMVQPGVAPMFKGLGQMASLMKQAQEMGGKMKELNERMATWRIIGAAGGGMVEVEIDGLGEVRQVKIDPALFAKGDREMIEALLPAAFNQASMKLKERHAAELGSMTQGADFSAFESLLGSLGPGK